VIIFSNRAAQHIAQPIQLPRGKCTIKTFADGEIFVCIDEDVSNKKVWVMASTRPPADNLMELFFLLDALQRSGASVNVCIIYFAYARQILASPGEAESAQVICNIFKNFDIKQLLIIHPHTLLLQNYLSFKPIYDLDFFCEQARDYDAIAAPDEGAFAFAQKVAQTCNKTLIAITKTRHAQEAVKIISVDGHVPAKKILLVDDMISTGHTLVAAATELKKQGAHTISAAATHGLFAPGSQELIEQSILKHVYVSNTVAQQSQGKITVVDISATLGKIMSEHSSQS